MISFTLAVIKLFNRIFENVLSISFDSSVLLERFKDFKAPTCFSVFPKLFVEENMLIWLVVLFGFYRT